MHAITDNLSNARRFSSLIVMWRMNLFYSMPYHRYIHVVLSSIPTKLQNSIQELENFEWIPTKTWKKLRTSASRQMKPTMTLSKIQFFLLCDFIFSSRKPVWCSLNDGCQVEVFFPAPPSFSFHWSVPFMLKFSIVIVSK